MVDALLIFPPQWSPFQPALSLPSLSAWLKRAGFDVTSIDLNLRLYEWLLSDEAATLLTEQLGRSAMAPQRRAAYETAFANAAAFRADIERLKTAAADETAMDYVVRTYLAVQSFETYLELVAALDDSFEISPYRFRLASGNLNAGQLERHVARPPRLLERYASIVVDELAATDAKMIGLSCIGQEQLYFTLLLGARLKQRTEAPVVVGGTIFSRIFERGVLPLDWFGRYFDVIVRNEGEKPAERMLANLRDGRPMTEGAPGVVHRRGGEIVAHEPCPPLSVGELPIPDFDDLPLDRYVSAEITLPLLSARGCYWGKCEFCHHGMVYGEKYAAYKPASLLDTVAFLAQRYGARHFAFNDEALPPTSARAMARSFPAHEQTGWSFTGLIKFEPSYDRQDFEGLHRVGFRSLYVGLESASERVLALMRKRSTRATIVGNLTDATTSGIWMHCFLFFGFPGETEEDAQETLDFIVQHPDIISSFGAGTFSLEHNAPIYHHFEDFGVRTRASGEGDVDVYYDYDVDRGVTAERALEWTDALTEATRRIPNYIAASWVPRELLLCMLSVLTPAELRRVGMAMRECAGMPPATRVSDVLSRSGPGIGAEATGEGAIVLNRINGRALFLTPRAAALLDRCCALGLAMDELRDMARPLFDSLAFADAEASLVPAPA